MLGCSLEIMELSLKERKILLIDEEEIFLVVLIKFDVFRDDLNEIWLMDLSSSNGFMIKRLIVLLEVSDDKISVYNFFVDESELIDVEYVRELFDYLRRFIDEKELCSSYKVNLLLFEGSEVNVL